jgi:hypothetical protein
MSLELQAEYFEMQSKTSIARVDHLIYGAPSLDTGVAAIRDLLGVEPGPGGRHPAFGTRNALLSLGPEQYFEIIAPDPDLAAPPQGRLFDLEALAEPRLIAWVLRTYDIHGDAERAQEAGVTLGAISGGSRTNPDGSVLEWRLTDPYAFSLDGAMPFLLDWGNAPHPGGSAPPAGTLTALHIEHPEPEKVERGLASFGMDLPVVAGASCRLEATIETAAGRVTVR